MKRSMVWVLAALCPAIAFWTQAAADDAPFLGTDPASVLDKGEKAMQQWLVFSHGHAGESYNAIQSETEFDYGLSDRLQLALSLLYNWSRTKPGGEAASSSSLAGLHGEAVWSVTSADKSPLGIAIAVDPAFNPSSRSLAVRLLLTKYLAHFENVLDINFENDWDKDPGGHWQPSSAISFNYGLAHPLNKHWTVAFEFGNEFAFDHILSLAGLNATAKTFYAGPTVQYECEHATFTLGVQTQLPLSSGNKVVNGYTADAERWHLAFRVSRAI